MPPGLDSLGLTASRAWSGHYREYRFDVGQRFAEEARRIHYGEVEVRGIRGIATPDEAKALREEGIEFASLPVPQALKEPLQ